MIFGMDSEMKTHVLTSYKLLDFLGDLGGFKEALNIIFSVFGTYFSAQFFRADFVENYFKEVQRTAIKSKVEFKKIKIPTLYMLLEPILNPLISIFCFCRRCCRSPKRIRKLLENGEERLEKHLEVTKLMKQVKRTHDILKSFYKHDKDAKFMAKVNKRFVLGSSSSENEEKV